MSSGDESTASAASLATAAAEETANLAAAYNTMQLSFGWVQDVAHHFIPMQGQTCLLLLRAMTGQCGMCLLQSAV